MKFISTAVLCAGASFAVFAQETKKDTTTINTINLQEVLVRGGDNDPNLSMVINQDSLNPVQPKNVADLFSGISGFTVVKRGNYAMDPSFRGSIYEQLNVQYDGGVKAMHACPNRMDPITTHVLPEEVRKIEVIKGPFSVRYGATFGGIVNFVTKVPRYENGLSGHVLGGYETNGGSYVTGAQLNFAKKGFFIAGNAGYRDFGSYSDGNGTEIPSYFKSTEYGVKTGYNFAKRHFIQLHWRQSFGRDIAHAGLPMDTDYDNSSIATLGYRYISNKDKFKALNFKAYYSFVDHLMTNTNRPNFMMVDAQSGVEATTLGGKLELELQPTKNLALFTGIDGMSVGRDGGRVRTVKLDMMGNPLVNPKVFNDKIWQNSTLTDIGVFAEGIYDFKRKRYLTVGLRYDNVTTSINDPEADFDALYDLQDRMEHNLSGTVSYKQKFSNLISLELAYGRGARSANMIERYINHFTVGQDAYEYVGNPDLKAEANNQFEIGLNGTTRTFKNVNGFSYSASIFYSKYENYILAVVDTTLNRKFMPTMMPQHVKVFRNLDNAYRTGGELTLKYKTSKNKQGFNITRIYYYFFRPLNCT